jgi:penicillin-insensitive murein endopeptidase
MPDGVPIQPMDSRGFFMLPQRPEDSGYYIYGTPAGGVFQYAHPAMMSLLLWVEREWEAVERRQFGIGNISQANGAATGEHRSHVNGLQADVRPLRKDGDHVPVTWHDPAYDGEATGKLIAIFFSHPLVKNILFNDTRIPGVKPWPKHDDHFHIEIKVSTK